MADDSGLSRFQRRMRALPTAVKEAVKPALERSGDEVAGAIRVLAPEDSGDLKDSVAVTLPGQATPPYSQPSGQQVAGETQVLITVGNEEVRYPHLVEYGTTKTAAQPFFWPAVRLSKKRATSRIKRAISAAVKKNWGKE